MAKAKRKKLKKRIRCARCGGVRTINESAAEGRWCPHCGASDQDE